MISWHIWSSSISMTASEHAQVRASGIRTRPPRSGYVLVNSSLVLGHAPWCFIRARVCSSFRPAALAHASIMSTDASSKVAAIR